MRIGVDGNLLCGKKTGMGIVAASILKNLELDDAEIAIFVPGKLDTELTEIFKEKNFEIVNCSSANYFKWEQLVLPKAVKKYNIDVLWCPYNTAPLKVSCPTVVTVHDVIYMSLKLKEASSLYKKAGLIYRRTVVPQAVKRAKEIVTISNYAKKDICESFPVAKDKIQVIYNSTDFEVCRLNPDEEHFFFKKHKIEKPYILGFGSLESRKNSMGLIKAYKRLNQELRDKYQLVLFGFRGYKESKEYAYIKENKITNIIVLEYVSDEEKNSLYKNSIMFVFPTFSEGFGIPILEAYVNGTPVITSNVTSLPEVAGNAAVLIDPHNTDEICVETERLLMNEDKRSDLIDKGKRQLDKFDWKKSAKEMYGILKEAGGIEE
ncbi:glycosyltransferase family 4 protein [Enterococcus columbae]|uniref:Glycosyl transferase family 1 domain-containing protein n=1 Tax=Enterococcus columbae DSM 7374 = ATCC 51263 TaxID=1121865 RepID=S0K7A5_9ENTE|nr:glycosyltransferase family 1 protein [Enterococcus columbae]EOT40462.1 hypothetical protein OMW_01324 [Enterococcus columbae DSM 7374 = ATCC 51263]EOW80238.1 hypothetical protein I568_01938 [Enterococcus columbae DSM 7374 = ATCC 51263]OJG25603.1 hypothetical protein RR47_GL001652 [Enterococcus columbae DSM 7374 = ATCC 51263]